MRLPELLIVLALAIAAFGFNRVFRQPRARGGSVKTALSIWLVLLVGGILIWYRSSHRLNARPLTLRAVITSAQTLS